MALSAKQVFALGTGRCGSTTFIHACSHITNFTSGHETRSRLLFENRLDYPPNHIEADNRLAWLLGRLDQRWGHSAYYVHLVRDREATARSFARRLDNKGSIIAAYRLAILMGARDAEPLEICRDYVDTVTTNIVLFLRDKPHVTVRLETAFNDFRYFWQWIGASGSLDAALAEWNVRHNSSPPIDGPDVAQ
ncbi:MAG TPA: hypothetical protein VNO69_02990 [Methyloceanibacter sp.]|nr:hypothetical protein [Methyloceanibacter sp.]